MIKKPFALNLQKTCLQDLEVLQSENKIENKLKAESLYIYYRSVFIEKVKKKNSIYSSHKTSTQKQLIEPEVFKKGDIDFKKSEESEYRESLRTEKD